MSGASGVDPDFASVMQDLSAQASPQGKSASQADLANGISAALSAMHSLGQRLEELEETVIRKFETLNLPKIEKDVTAIRESESVNQRLFDSLHEELKAYRDNLIRESLQKPFIRDLLVLFDDLNAIAVEAEERARNSKARPHEIRFRDNLNNLLHFLIEMLQRLEVCEMEPETKVDRSRQKVLEIKSTANPAEDGTIVKQVKRGFTWHGQVLRPAEVIIKKLS